MRCIIAGSRDAPREVVNAAMRAAPFANKITVVICGTAKGADTWGEVWARQKKLPVEYCRPDIDRFGIPEAFMQRNQAMVNNAECMVNVWDGTSTGSRDCITRARVDQLLMYIFFYTYPVVSALPKWLVDLEKRGPNVSTNLDGIIRRKSG